MPIELRHQTYFAYLDVPADLRRALGRRVYRKTLQTDSRSVALRRAAPLIAQWKAAIARLRDESDHDDAKYWRDALRRAPDEKAREAIKEQIDMAAWDIGAITVDRIGESPSQSPEARKFYSEAVGSRVPTDEYLDEWINSLSVKDKTSKMRKAAVMRLQDRFPTLQEISRKEVRRWINELTTGLKAATIQRMISDCRGYWSYLQTIEVVSDELNPFDRLGLKVKKSSWVPYTASEARTLLKAAHKDDPMLANLIQLAMYTGARREEISCLRVEHIKDGCFSIVDAKTEAGIRSVPIHPKLKALVQKLGKASNDGYLLSGQAPNGNGDRGDALGKRFTRLKRSMGFDARHVFHSFRGTVITILEHAGVPEGTVQDIVGHERSTLTGNTYSGKSTMKMRMAALAKLKY